jgi:hypothetical protein
MKTIKCQSLHIATGIVTDFRCDVRRRAGKRRTAINCCRTIKTTRKCGVYCKRYISQSDRSQANPCAALLFSRQHSTFQGSKFSLSLHLDIDMYVGSAQPVAASTRLHTLVLAFLVGPLCRDPFLAHIKFLPATRRIARQIRRTSGHCFIVCIIVYQTSSCPVRWSALSARGQGAQKFSSHHYEC